MAEAERWVWLGGSLLLAVVATQAAWWLRRWGKSQAQVDRLVSSPFFPLLLQATRLLYAIGLPFAALVWGHDAVVGRLLGLQPLAANWTDWARDVSWAVGLGFAAWAVLAAGWWAVRRAGSDSEPIYIPASAWLLLREAAFHEVHWAFYRNAPIVALWATMGAARGTYWGTWAGVGLVALEAALNPWYRSALGDNSRRPAKLVRAGLSTLSAALYLETGNLWLAILTHWAVTWGLAAWTQALGRPNWRRGNIGEV